MRPTTLFQHRIVVLGVLLGVLSTSMAYGSSRVFVQNNTTKDLWFNTTSTLNGSWWKSKATKVISGARAEIFETNRDKGVKSGQTFYFTSDVSVKDPAKKGQAIRQRKQKFALRLQLKGSTVGSHMWQSVRDQSGKQHAWHDDRKKRNAGMRVGNRQWNVRYWAFFTGTDDNVEYVFQEEYPLPEGNRPKMSYERQKHHLNVLAYNVYMRPTPTHGTPLSPSTNAGMGTFFNGQSIRAGMIPGKIPGYDVVVFQEAFDDPVREKLLNLLKKEYPYQSRILGEDEGLEQDGGVIILSKWPIVNGKGAQKFFGDVCSGFDCWAEKGVLYVKINKTRKPGEKNYFHIFGTHMNAGDWSKQEQQLRIIKNFIDAQPIPKTEPVIIAGDFNVNMYGSHYRRKADKDPPGMLDILNAAYMVPSFNQLRGHRYTHDGPLNDLGSGSQSYYDYVLVSNDHVKMTKASFAEVRMLRSNDEWKEFPHEPAMWDLSDHFAVYASLHFHYDPLAGFDPGLVTNPLSRYWKKKSNHFAALATSQQKNGVQGQGYQYVGTHGLLFKTHAEAEKWSKSAPPDPGKKRMRQSSQRRRSLSRIRSRGIQEGGEGSQEMVEDVIEDSEFIEEGDDMEVAEEDSAELEENVEEMSSVEEEGTELAMGEDPEDTGEVVERGIRKMQRSKGPRRLSRKRSQPSSGRKVAKSQGKGSNLTVLPIVPLNLYYSDKYKDYYSTTSVARAKQAMQGPGKYRHVGVQGYVYTREMYRKLPNFLRSRMIAMDSWYNPKTRDNLIATGPGDVQHAKKSGYKRVAQEGFLIKRDAFPPKTCKANSDCPSDHFCNTKKKICVPDIR